MWCEPALRITSATDEHMQKAVSEMKAVYAQVVCCVYVKPTKIMQPMHGIILYMFDCWADPVVHLLLLKSSLAGSIDRMQRGGGGHGTCLFMQKR